MFHISRLFCASPILRPARRRRGAALVEFAFVSALLLTIVLGILQFGIYLNATNALWNLSREGARYAAVQSSTTSTNAQIVSYIQKVMPPTLDKNDMAVTITPSDPSLRTSGTMVTVQIAYNMRKKILLVSTPASSKTDWQRHYIAGLATTYVTVSSMMVE